VESISEQDLLTRHIEPNHQVLVVGPHYIHADPSPLFVCSIVKKPKGGVTFLDAQSKWAMNTLNKAFTGKKLLKSLGNNAQTKKLFAARVFLSRNLAEGTAGDPVSYRAGLREYKRTNGIDIISPKIWLGDANETQLPANSFDSILDRGSAWFILGHTHTFEENFNREAALEKTKNLLNEYLRVLKPGGKAILLFGKLSSTREFKQIILTAAQNIGNIMEHKISSSVYHIGSNRHSPQFSNNHALVITKV